MTERDRWIERHLFRLRCGQFLKRAAEWLAGYLFVFGTIVLLVKLTAPAFWPQVLWLLLLAVPVTYLAWHFAYRRAFTRRESVALLDQRLEAGGLLMALSEADAEEWQQYLPQAEELWQQSMPRIRPTRFSRYLGLPLLFVVGACLVPIRQSEATPVRHNAVGQTASSELEELLEELDEAAVLAPEEKTALQEEIEKLQAETQDNPLTHEKWEVVDYLREQMRLRVETSSLEISKAQAALGQLREANNSDNLELTDDQLLKLEKDVFETLKKLSENGDFSNLSPEMQDMLMRLTKKKEQQLPGDPAERQEMIDDLQEFLDQEAERLEQLRQKCQGGNCQGDGQEPGRGGVSRGRGDASMQYGDESDRSGTEFKETILPPGFLEDPANTVIRESLTAPKVEPEAVQARAARSRVDPASGRATWNRKVRPRHRSVVKKYFDNE